MARRKRPEARKTPDDLRERQDDLAEDRYNASGLVGQPRTGEQ